MTIESGVPLLLAEGVRPNRENDKLAGYMFPGVRTLASPAIDLLKTGIVEGLFTDVETECREVPMYLSGHGEVMLGDGNNRPRVAATDVAADLLIVTAILESTPTFEQEAPFSETLYVAKQALEASFKEQQDAFMTYLQEYRRSEHTARNQANRRMLYSKNQFGSAYVLRQDGTLKDVVGRIGYAFLDWQVDLYLEEGDYENAPTIRNTRDVFRLSMVEFRAALVGENRSAR